MGFAHAASSGQLVARLCLGTNVLALAPIYSEVLSDAKGISENGMWSPSGWRSVCVTSCSERSACEAYLEKEIFFFGRNVGARCSLAAEKGACGGQRGGPRPGRSGWRASSRGGRGPVNARFWGPSSASCSMEVRSAHNGLLTGRAMASKSCHRAVPTPRSEWAASWSHSGRSGGCKPGLLVPGGLGCGDRNSRGPEPSPHWVGE